MKSAVLAAVLAAGACNRAPVPPPSPSPPPVATVDVDQELVEAGCLPPPSGDGGEAAEAFASDARPDWYNCLLDGGTLQACGVQCGPDQ